MRLIRFERLDAPGDISWGQLTDETIFDIGRMPETPATCILDAIAKWSELRPQWDQLVAHAPRITTEVRLLSPVPEPKKILCIGLNYRDHAIESGMAIPTEPVVFNKLSGSVCGHDAIVPLPRVSQQVDYEAELVLVMGRRAWQVSEDHASNYIFGYTVGHDVSARDWQLGRPGGQWLLGKSFPNFAPIGPALVPREFIADPCQLDISLRINGETLQNSSTRQLIFNPSQLVSHLSQCCVLEPGDIIFTGTPPGVGMARKPQRFVKSGDICEIEIEGIGVLRNRFE
jgi:2-keto-4-pentenoate hydratase/2-oxohepta-3-ene-1,7-dioic acid hydratase in catechol pathway